MRYLFTLLTILTAAVPGEASAAPVEFTCRVCSQSAVPEVLRAADAQFSVVVTGRTTDGGAFGELSVAHSPEMVDSQAILRCLKSWQVRGIGPGVQITVVMNWKWGSWRRISVRAGETTQTVELTPDDADP